MIRIIVENLLLFLLPTLAYAAYEIVKRFGRPDNAPAATLLDEAPLAWLLGAGALLVVVVTLVFGSTSGGRPGQSYEPSVFKDGQIQPGRIK